jgi:hypothetical protein
MFFTQGLHRTNQCVMLPRAEVRVKRGLIGPTLQDLNGLALMIQAKGKPQTPPLRADDGTETIQCLHYLGHFSRL